MYHKTLALVLLALLPLYASAGFYAGKAMAGTNTTINVNANKADALSPAPNYPMLSPATMPKSWTDLDYGILSFAFALAGLTAAGIMLALWSTSIVGACLSAAGVLILGLGALGTGYMSFGGTHHHHIHDDIRPGKPVHRRGATLAGIGFTLGIIESLPVLLVGGLFVSIFEIGRFVFRRKHKKSNEPTTQIQP